MDIEQLAQQFDGHHNEVSALLKKAAENNEGLAARIDEIEQKNARRGTHGSDGGGNDLTIGQMVVQSDEYKNNIGMRDRRGKVQISVKNTITTTVAGAMVPPDNRPGVVALPTQRLTVRDLIAPGTTNSNLVQYPRQTVRTNRAAVVSEGATKPQSDYEFELQDAPVRTVAHWTKASRQIWDDAPMLQSTIDGELRYGLKLAEEVELLFGDGTGQHIYGIIPQATAYSAPFLPAVPTMFDTVFLALVQAQQALLPATGIVLNDTDLSKMQLIKDNEGRYIAGGPFGPPITTMWGRPVVGTPSMTQDKFLVGAFRDGSQIFDRQEMTVLISSENDLDFVKNLLTILCEERLSLAVKRPAAFTFGDFGLQT